MLATIVAMAAKSTLRIGIDIQTSGPFILRALPGLIRLSHERPDIQFVAVRDTEEGWLVRQAGFSGLLAHFSARSAAMARDAGLKYVSILRPGDRSVPAVSTDEASSGRIAGEHFVELGIRSAGFFFDGERKSNSNQRLTGLRHSLDQIGIEPAVFLIGPRTEARGTWTYADQIADLADWLRAQPKPFGLLASDDSHAVRATEACRMAGLQVPQDVAIIGISDDEQYCAFSDPPLSSVRIDAPRIGYEAGKWLIDILEGRREPEGRCINVPPVGITKRRSTDLYVNADADVAEAMRIINMSPGREIDIQQVADTVSLSRKTLERRFREQLGATPGEMMRRARIRKAVRLISETDMPLVEVAIDAGFTSISQLSRDIKQATGKTPTQIRRAGGSRM